MTAGRVFLVLSVVGAGAMAMLSTTSGLFLIADVGLSPLQLVLVGSVLEGTVLLFEVPTGVVADVVSRRLSVLVGMALMGAGLCLFAVPVYAVILGAQVVWGLGATFVSGASVAWVVDEVGEDEGRPLLLRAANLGQGAAIVGIVLGVLLGAVELWLPLVAGGAAFLVLTAWAVVAMEEHGFTRPERVEGSSAMRETIRSARQVARGRPVLYAVLLVAVLHGMSSEGFDRLWELRLLEAVDLPDAGSLGALPWFGGLRVAGIALAVVLTRRVRRTVNAADPVAVARALVLVTVLLVTAMAGYGVVDVLPLALACHLGVTALRMVHGPLTTAWLNTGLDSRSRATVNSVAQQADALGQVGAGPALGWLASARTVSTALVVAAAAQAPTIPVLGRAHRRETAPSVGP